MAHHKSSKKRILQDEKKRLRNRYYKKSTRTAIRKFRSLEDKSVADEMLPGLYSMIDRLAKRNIWHKNKAANLKSGLANFVKTIA